MRRLKTIIKRGASVISNPEDAEPEQRRRPTGPVPAPDPLRLQRLQNGVMDRPSFAAHFIVGRILDRMLDQKIARIAHAERLALRICGLIEFAGRDRDRRKALDFEPYSVVQTARRA